MEFSRKKLPKEAAATLRSCPIHTVKPFVIMPAPVYVLMQRNEKFVSVKAPLDFFNPEELKRLEPFESVFFPEFVDSITPFKNAARRVKALLSWSPPPADAGASMYPSVSLPPSPYELSDAVLRIIGSLWSGDLTVEPFFAAVFSAELCDPIEPGILTIKRDRDVIGYERGMLVAGCAVFLALHLGFCQLEFLNRLYTRVFSGEEIELGDDVAEMVAFVEHCIRSNDKIVQGNFFSERVEKVAQKVSSRLRRVKQELVRAGATIPTIFGQKGFVDV